MSFNTWGERRNPDMSSGPASSAGTTTRGYTGHEMLDDHGLIHMNGRVYDPNIGRFLSADIVVQSPSNSQSYNRYSYVLNNPLSLIDPSGYCNTTHYDPDPTGCGQMVDDLGGPATMPCEQGGDMETCEVTGYVPPGACGADVDCQMNEYLQATDKMHDEFIEQTQPPDDMFGASTEQTSAQKGLIYDPNDPNYHSYYLRTAMCNLGKNGCSVEMVMGSTERESVPFVIAPKTGEPLTLAGGNPIKHYSGENWSLNMTMEGYTYHPGQVLHVVTAEQGVVYLNTYGEGTGPSPWLNNAVGYTLFGKMHADVWTSVKTQQIQNFYSDLFK
ncbi:RHS repeat-associated core domain-containing protein [Gayadomonas joobiniege]|uniref:RHS repeat-associated core domain-containing protein n=1 Tax=Gayadomonas joobiniege TaxID=1234606 RepID=UPI00037C3035|nr:RHS repeat-associated core domain-containing protein [Gayadomonas joobiniege]